MTVPRLLVVTDADLSPESRGAGRTLLNSLVAWPADAARVITTADITPGRTAGGHQIVSAGWRPPGGIAERLRPFLGDLHAQAMTIAPLAREAIAGFVAEVTLVVPTTPAALVLGARWAREMRVPSATWLMDDWVQQYHQRWVTGTAEAAARQLLRENAGWLVISEYLGEELRRWTGLQRPTHVVHNAVAIGNPPATLGSDRTGRFIIRYAGSIWPMHADALGLVAHAVAARRNAGDDVELVLHADERGWKQHEPVWTDTGTRYGGLVAYDMLRSVLGDSDLLVVASSFDSAHARMTRSSVQTKITDYFATGRAILNVGPADGACANFLRERDAAVVADTPSVDAIAGVIADAIRNRPRLRETARRAWEVCARDHEIGAVSASMAKFLGSIAKR